MESIGTGEQNKVGLLSGSEYTARRSRTLIENPQARLDERTEVASYLKTLDPEYLRELRALDERIGNPMSADCRVAIGIPALNEGRNIRKTLELYTNQKDKDGNPLDKSIFEITTLDNHPADVAKDQTEEEIEEFKRLHPDMRINYVHKEWKPHDPATVGNARKHISDLTLLRDLERNQQTGGLILVSNDADAEEIDEHYVTDLIDAFDTNPNVDAYTAKFDLPESALQKPNVLAAARLWSYIAIVAEAGAIGNVAERHKEPTGLVGRNASVRASTYAAVGGYNPHAKNAEDLEMGWVIADARDWDPQSVSFLHRAEIVSNPRRHLAAVATKTPVNEMYVDFQKHPEIRTMDNNELLSLIPDNLDVDQLEEEANSWWHSRDRGEYKYLRSRFEPILHRAMNLLGVQYEVVGDDIHITSIEKLLDGLSKKYGRKVEALPQNQKGTEPQEKIDIERFVSYGSSLTRGMVEVRAAKANNLAQRISAMRQRNDLTSEDQEELEGLKKEYKRFTDGDYENKDLTIEESE